ncbi:aminotransferase class V-fold PLP-dependent enzyme [Microlunatus speluncae]|uniref:aminotransferase class V-fold PLP-dependent enzyme n=1 Tax=Microlunatus speluncae TaxID=2594267 RepID=UPI0012661ED5|nr:aminotransferase class V-fold PLP-dependent enzyme [Microlunatus speluncae]
MSLYADLGLRPVINARGTLTVLGGSVMDPAVLQAMTEASTAFVDLVLLQRRAGERIAGLLGVEAACITSGAAAGLTIATAALMAGDRIDAIRALPDTTGLRDQVVVLKSHRILYDQAVLLAGARFVEVGVTSAATPEQVAAAITDRTAGLFFVEEASTMRGSLPLGELITLAHDRGVPVLVDAAAELPPADNVRHYLDLGADLVVFSGGKEIGGPQSSGLIVGREPYVGHCHANSFPQHGIGRGMKTDKETIAGLVKAVELWVGRDYDLIFEQWNAVVDTVLERFAGIPELTVERGFPTEPGIQPTVIPRAYLTHATRPAADLQTALLDRDQPVAVGIENGRLAVNPQCLKPDEVPILITALQELFVP